MSHKTYRTDKNCLNCGAFVEQKFCPNCGQENLELKESFFHMVGHVIGDFFHFDSKFFRSFIPLFTKPGFLTNEYWSGRRAHYIHPLRLFFFVTIVMVIISNAYYHKYEHLIKEEKIVRTGPAPNSAESKKEFEEKEREITSMVDRTFNFLANYLKYISFLLLPLYALIFKIFYWRHKKLYLEHLTYTLHLQSFAYIIISLLLLIPLFITPSARDWYDFAFIGITTIYMVFSLRFLYKQSWMKTILKTIIVSSVIILTTVVVVGVIMLTFLHSE